MVFLILKYCVRLTIFREFKNNIQNPFACLIHYVFIQTSIPDRFHDQCVVDPAGSRHFQIHTGFQRLYTVIDRAPVRHDVSVKSPLVTQDICQIFSALSHIGSVDPVIRIHHRPGLRLSDCALKCRQIDFPERPFVHLRRIGHPPFFLIVRQKMLHADAHILTLYALRQCCRHLRCHKRIFRIIFKVTSAQRRTFDVHRRTKNRAHIFRLTFLPDRLS